MHEGTPQGRFLLLGLRDGEEAAAAEYADFLQATGLPEDRLDYHRILSTDDGLPNLAAYDGVFAGGSPFNVTDLEHPPLQKHVHDLLYRVVRSPVPALLVCYGSSYAAFDGRGRVDRANGERAGLSRVVLTDAAAADPVFGNLPLEFNAATGHKESVAELPPGATLMATGPTCPVQAYRVNRTTWVTQFHPEMDADGLIRRMMFYVDDGYFDMGEVEEIDRLTHEDGLTDGAALCASFMAHCLTLPRCADVPRRAAG